MKIRPQARAKYERFLALGIKEPQRLAPTPKAETGLSALNAFHLFESTGKIAPTTEPARFDAMLTGKEIHGMTVAAVAEDFAINRTAFSSEINANYPAWVAAEIFAQAAKIAKARIGFMPAFISNH